MNNNEEHTHTDSISERLLGIERMVHDNQLHDSDIIDLAEIWNKLWADKWLIIVIGSIFVVSSIFYALSLSDEYESQVLLAPVSSGDAGGGSLSKLAGKFGGLASLAGINLGDNSDKTSLALEIIKSRSFVTKFIEDNDLLVPLMAGEKWDSENNKLIINSELYSEGVWVRDVSPPKKTIPSGLEAYEKFLERLSVNKNEENGYITISIEFYSPYLAKSWLELLIKEINDTVRKQDILEASKTIKYLESKADETVINEMKKVFYDLIESQTQTLMLANVRDEYVFKTIDPAYLAEEKSKPKRAFIVIFAAFLGGLIGIAVSLLRKRNEN